MLCEATFGVVKMASFSHHRWLQSIGKVQYSALFTEQGLSTIEKCASVTGKVLRKMGIDDYSDRNYILLEAERLKGDIAVSVLHRVLYIIISSDTSYCIVDVTPKKGIGTCVA